MPLKTFINLSEERQKVILNICFEEFAQNDYDSASLSRIISKLGLAKGSFYRYFENKKDLYFYLSEYAGKLIHVSFSKHLNESGKDFFNDWIEFFLSFKEIEKEFPMLIRFRFKAASEKSSEIYQGSRRIIRSEKTDFIKDAIKQYQEKGVIRKDIDITFVSLLMMYFNIAVSDYITTKYDIEKGDPVFSIQEDVLKNDVLSYIKIIKEGLQI